MSNKVRLLSEPDIFDVYGCQELLQRPMLDGTALATVKSRVYEIHGMYVDAAKARIRSEARFVRSLLEGEEPTLQQMVSNIKDMLAKNIQAKQLAGKPVNLMAEVIRARQSSGMSMVGIDMARFGVKEVKFEKPPSIDVDPAWFTKRPDTRVWDNPRWAEIATAYLDLEKASDPTAMILAIDRLNQLQHNSFHLLIDLQSGRMLENSSEGATYGDHGAARLNVQKVLDICAQKESVYSYLDKLSPEIRALLQQFRATKRQVGIEKSHLGSGRLFKPPGHKG